MSGPIKRIDVRALKAALHDGLEIALLDAREELTFGERHILMAACMPLGRIEVLADDMVPRRQTRVVWCDDGGGLGERAAQQMADLGYSDVSVLDGGIAAWERRRLSHLQRRARAEQGIRRGCRARPRHALDHGHGAQGADRCRQGHRRFRQSLLHRVPRQLHSDRGQRPWRRTSLPLQGSRAVIEHDGDRQLRRPDAQHHRRPVPNQCRRSQQGGLVEGRHHGLAPCGLPGRRGRRPEAARCLTRIRRRPRADRVERVAKGLRIPRIETATLAAWRAESERRSLYVLDVRTPEEYEAGHVAGIRSAPGGQLVQETDNYLATWGARVVLADTDGVRAVMTASWLKQMGWCDVAVIRLEDLPGTRVTGPHRPLVLGLEHARVAAISPAELKRQLEAGTVTLIDLEYSKLYRNGHIPGAWFATRTRLGAALEKLPPAESIVLTSPDGDLARIAATELARTAAQPVRALEGGTRAWTLAGYPLAKETDRMAETPDDVWLPARERGGDRESAMRAYLAWEIELVNQMATDDDHRFKVVKV